jgi:hypothetical protein
MTKHPRPEDGATGLRCKFDRHPRIVAGGKRRVKDNQLVIRMMGEFVTRGREVMWHEGVAGGVDSNELWKYFKSAHGAARKESKSCQVYSVKEPTP